MRKIIFPLILLVLLVAAFVYLMLNQPEKPMGGDPIHAKTPNPKETHLAKESRRPDIEDDNVFRIVLDAGHGGHDVGTMGPDDRYEKDDVLRLTLKVEAALLAAKEDVEVLLTRTTDVFLEPSKRCDIANEWNADVFVSLHRNNGGGHGLEVWKSTNSDSDEDALSESIHETLLQVGDLRDRGVRAGTPSNSGADFVVNRETYMTSCLLELGFMDCEEDNLWFDENLDDIADAIAQGILACYDTYSS